MKKNILLVLPLISTTSLMSMNNQPNPLMETVIFTAREESLGFMRSLSDFKWEKDNLYNDLEKQEYDPRNLVYSDKYDRTMVAFAHEKDPRLLGLIDLSVKHYPGQIKPGNGTALAAYNRLIEEKEAQQLSLKKIIETNDQEYIEKQNVILAAIKKSILDQITIMQTNLKTHLENRETIVQTNCEEIRKLETSIANLYQLNKQFKLPDGGQKAEAKIAPDKCILQDIQVDELMFATQDKTERTLHSLFEANSLLQMTHELR